MTRCAICCLPVDPTHHTTWQQTIAWKKVAGVRMSGKHGGVDVRGYRDQQVWAHGHCLDRQKAGLLGQEGLRL